MATGDGGDEERRWLVYVVESAVARRTYVGITNDVERRVRQHNGALPGGAKSTRAHRPWRLAIVYGPFADRGEASRCEAEVKRRRGRARLAAPFAVVAPADITRGVDAD